MSLLPILAAVAAAFWLALALLPARRFPKDHFLRPSPARSTDPSAAPRREGAVQVLAIVPARDEATTLPRTLPSLLEQEALDAVIVVDDESEDGTAQVARQLEAQLRGESTAFGLRTPKLVVIDSGSKPDGWSGKVSALATGVEKAGELAPRSEVARFFLFSDADIAHRPSSVRDLLATAKQGRYELVSVMARLSATSFWERLLVPPFVYFFHLLYPFRQVSDPASRVAAAAGGCVLVEAAALERAGGLERIAGELIDDVSLARAVKGTGARIWLGLDAGILSIRDYGFRDLWNMVARNAFVQLRYRWSLLVGVLAGIAVLVTAPPLYLALGLLQATAGGWDEGAAILVACGGLAWLLSALALLPFARHHRVGAAWGFTLPVAALFYGAMTLGSAISHLRGASSRWRGRVYRRDRLRSGSRESQG